MIDNFTEVKKITLHLMELVKELEDKNGKKWALLERCGTSCVKCVHHVK